MYRLKSRKFWMVTFVVASGVLAALFLPAIPVFGWLKGHTGTVFAAVAGLVTFYIGGNLAASWINNKKGPGEYDGESY